MPTNKVQLSDGTVLVDLTDDTVTADTIVSGYTAHDASGNSIVGTCINIPLIPIAYDYEPGYTANGTYKYENSTNNHSDVYVVGGGRRYLLGLGPTVGTRFRSAFLTTNPVGTLVDVPGKQLINQNNPSANAYVAFIADSDGYVVVTKDNASHKGLKSYLFDLTVDS